MTESEQRECPYSANRLIILDICWEAWGDPGPCVNVFVSVPSGRATNHHAMMAVGYVWFGCVIFLCDCGVVGIRVRRKYGLFLFVRLLVVFNCFLLLIPCFVVFAL